MMTTISAPQSWSFLRVNPGAAVAVFLQKIKFVKDAQTYLSLATLFLSLSAFTQVLLSTPPSLTLFFYFIYTKNDNFF